MYKDTKEIEMVLELGKPLFHGVLRHNLLDLFDSDNFHHTSFSRMRGESDIQGGWWE